jgi:hypothetical protein
MKGERLFILRSDAIRAAATAFVGEQPLTDPPLEVVVRRHQDKRSRDQNALYWSWLHVIGDDLGYSAEEVHEALKVQLLPLKQVVLDEVSRSAPISVTTSTAKLPVSDFAAYMDKVAAWATSQGIRLPG